MDSQKVKTSIFVHCDTLKLHALKFFFVLFAPFCGHINIRYSFFHSLFFDLTGRLFGRRLG